VENTTQYNNHYGSLTLDIVGEEQLARNFTSADVPDDCFIDLNTAEEVALITENRGIQIAFRWITEKEVPDPKQGYILLHRSPSVVVLTRLSSLDYTHSTGPRDALF